MNIASNTGPLIALAKINALDVLSKLAPEVHIPPAVHRELLAKIGPEAGRIDTALQTFVKVIPLPRTAVPQHDSLKRLGLGEFEAILLAASTGKILLMDDLLARSVAGDMHIALTGTAGILVRAKHAGIISQVRPMLESLRNEGYWLSDALLASAIKLAGE